MPPFDFPNAPIADQEHSQNGVSYTYTGKVWNLTPPDPTNLQIQFDRKVDVAGDNMTGHLGLPFGDPERNQAVPRSFVENYFPKEAPYTTPANPNIAYARRGGLYTPGDASYPLATEGEWVETSVFVDAPITGNTYGRHRGEWVVVPPEVGTPGVLTGQVFVRRVDEWVEGVTKEYVDDIRAELEHADRNKVDKGGDIMSGRLTLPMLLANPIQPGPPIEMPERADDAVHKAYVDARTSVQEAPEDARTWARRDLHWVLINIQDVDQLERQLVIRPTEAPADGLAYVRINEGWQPLPETLQDIPIMLDRKVDVAGDNMIGHLGLPTSDPERHQAITRSWVENYYTQEAPYTDPAKPDMLYGRRGGVYTPGDSSYPLATEGEWLPTVPEAPVDGLTYGRNDNTWTEVADKGYVDQMDRNKVDKSGDIMSGRLTLPMRLANPIQPGPPIEMPERPDDAVHKQYVDDMTGRSVITDLEPPLDPKDGALWWDEDTGGLYLFYDDGTSAQWIQVNGIGGATSTTFDSAPVTNAAYGLLNKTWSPVHTAYIGDIKTGVQKTDHGGWIKLDGRAINTLQPNQQAAAIYCGWITNLPNAQNSIPWTNGTELGTISGGMTRSVTITQANLPDIDLTAGSAGGHLHTVDSGGGHTHVSYGSDGSDRSFDDLSTSQDSWGIKFKNDTVIFATNDSDFQTRYIVNSVGGHIHTMNNTGAHEHGVPLGGSGTALSIDVRPQCLSVNTFCYLGHAAADTGVQSAGGFY